jgi:NAD(P)H-flavin reductase
LPFKCDLQRYTEGAVVSRPYTPISSDDDAGVVEFCIKVYDKGRVVCSSA